MSRDETGHGSNFCEQSNLVNLGNNSIHYFSLKGSENNSLIFDRVQHKASARLDDTGANIVNGGDRNHKTILASTCPFHFSEKLLFYCIEQVWPKISRMQENFMFQGDVIKHSAQETLLTGAIYRKCVYVQCPNNKARSN